MTIESASGVPSEFRFTVLVVGVLMATGAMYQIYISLLVGSPFNAAVAVLLVVGVVGITRKVRWGFWIAAAFLWGSILVSFGTLSPFSAGDLMAEGIEPPSLLQLALRFSGVCVIALICLHYLGKYKSLFRSAWI